MMEHHNNLATEIRDEETERHSLEPTSDLTNDSVSLKKRYQEQEQLIAETHKLYDTAHSFQNHLSEFQGKNDSTLLPLVNCFQEIILTLGKYQKQIEEQHKRIDQIHLKIIKEQELTITILKRKNLSAETFKKIVKNPITLILKPLRFIKKCLRQGARSIKKHFRPGIGVLYHYSPRDMYIPEHYGENPRLENTPTISIVTPSYNQDRFLEKTIQSVLNQNYPSLQYVIQDGNSSDQSAEVIRRYEHQLFHWESKADKGQSHAINLGFKHMTGEIMAYLNSDDILLPGTLHYIADYFNKHPDVDVIYGHRILIDEENQEVGRWILPPHDNAILSWADYIPQETLFWRRRIWEKIGGNIDESFKFAMDWDLILRFRDAGAKFTRLPRFLGAFRIHATQKTSSMMSKIGMEEINFLRKRANGKLICPCDIAHNIRTYKMKHLIYHNLYRIGILRY